MVLSYYLVVFWGMMVVRVAKLLQDVYNGAR